MSDVLRQLPPFSSAYHSLEDGETLSNRPEFSLYVAIKIYLYQRLIAVMRGAPQDGRMPQAILGGLSARKLCRIMSSRRRDPKNKSDQFTDFFDTSTQFVRERLKSLNHGTVIDLRGHGLRNANLYAWNEPVTDSTISSFRALHQALGGRMNLALDLYRMAEHFPPATEIRVTDFVHLFRDYRKRFVERRWYQISTTTQASSILFTRFLMGRLAELVRTGLLATDPSGTELRFTARGLEAAHWFELFAYSASYAPTPHIGTGAAARPLPT